MPVGVMSEEDFAIQIKQIDEDPRVVVNDDGTKTVKLLEPVTFKGEEITELTFQRPKGKDWLKTDEQKGDLGKAFSLAASICGKPMSLFCAMNGEDALFCSQVASTMGKKFPTGGS